MPVISTAITAVIAGIVLAIAPSVRQPSAYDTARKLVFSVPLREFIAASDDPRHDTRLDWASDKCSAPLFGSAGRTYDFSLACRRHDFAYRNFSRLDGGRHWDAAMRARVDDRFMADMRADCAARPSVQRTACRAWARLYFSAVRQFAGP